MNVTHCPIPDSSTRPSDRWEELLLHPDNVSLQLDPATGCGPACLEMLLTLEGGGDPASAGQDQESLAALCQATSSPDDQPHPFAWDTCPARLQHAINSHPLPGDKRPPGLRHYHIVHAASPDGPLEEVLSWLRGHQTVARMLRLPSCLLIHHGTHWMLAVGAKVDAQRLLWLALADPASGRLLGLTAAGVAHTFSPNTIGKHPDWTGRHVAVIPSVLPRRPPTGTPPPEISPTAPTPTAQPSTRPPPTAISFAHTPLSGLGDHDQARLLDALVGFAREASHPFTRDWLAPLLQARRVVTDDPVATTATRPFARGTRRAWVLDARHTWIAEIIIRGTPPILLQFSMVTPADPTAPPVPATAPDARHAGTGGAPPTPAPAPTCLQEDRRRPGAAGHTA